MVLSLRVVPQKTRVLAVGLGNMGAPLSGQVARKFPTAVFDLNAKAIAAHNEAWGSLPTTDLVSEARAAEVVVTCLPNSNFVTDTKDRLKEAGALQEGTLWVDATSGRAEDAAELADELWSEHGVRYLDCAVSGGPAGARRGELAVLVGGDHAAFQAARPILECFGGGEEKITFLGPAGSGHLVKAVNNAMLGAHLAVAGEAMACLQREGIDLQAALKAINASSGRSWATMQRFPDNILTMLTMNPDLSPVPRGKGEPYGFALGLHCKDITNALRVVNDGGVEAPMLQRAAEVMGEARALYGDDVDHTEVTRLAAERNGVGF